MWVYVYRRPNSDIAAFENYVSKCLTIITKENKKCYLSGSIQFNSIQFNSIQFR